MLNTSSLLTFIILRDHMMVNGVARHWRSLTGTSEWSSMLYVGLCVIAW